MKLTVLLNNQQQNNDHYQFAMFEEIKINMKMVRTFVEYLRSQTASIFTQKRMPLLYKYTVNAITHYSTRYNYVCTWLQLLYKTV